jgi:excisionase family DNA binding protein
MDAMTVAEAASYMRVSRDTVYSLVAERKIRHRRVGRAIRFDKADLQNYWDGCAVEPASVPMRQVKAKPVGNGFRFIDPSRAGMLS